MFAKVGDKVKVVFPEFEGNKIDKAEVLYIPASEDDCWVFRDMSTGFIKYFSKKRVILSPLL